MRFCISNARFMFVFGGGRLNFLKRRFRDQGLLFFVSSTVGESAAAPGDAMAGGAEVANREGGVKVEEGVDVDDGVFMVNLEPSSPIVWQQRFHSLGETRRYA